jgi:BirA family transcriptional regulator, biotin operon repressor / biotin---[acetyl-CoA-carboxylase] ligase
MNLDLLNEELIKENLLSKIIYFDELGSTNDFAKRSNPDSNTLVITSYQTNGTGRFGRPWQTVPGKNLTFTLIKSFEIGIDEIHLVNFYSSYILCETLKNFTVSQSNTGVNLKWPNDIMFNTKKVAGFLLDVKDLKSVLKKFIIGTGININQEIFPEELTNKATSMLLETKTEINPELLLIHFIKNFYQNLFLTENKKELMNKWNLNSQIEGKKIRFKKLEDGLEQPATALWINDDGALKVKFDDGKESKFYSGEISIVY